MHKGSFCHVQCLIKPSLKSGEIFKLMQPTHMQKAHDKGIIILKAKLSGVLTNTDTACFPKAVLAI